MQINGSWKNAAASPLFLPAVFGLLVFTGHLVVNAFTAYGYFRDELYYLACADHLAAGYVDHPPLSIWLLALQRFVIGDSLFALRFLPAVASGFTIFLVGLLVTEMGGSRPAQVLGSLGASVSLIFLGFGTIYSMNAFDLLLWTLALLLLLRVVRRSSIEGWVLLGVVLGLGLLNKTSVLWLGVGIGAALAMTPSRSELRRPGPWLAVGIALLFFLPYVVWNATHEWAHLEFIRNATAQKYSTLGFIDLVTGQFLLQNPVTAPLWLAGLVFLFSPSGRPWRAAGIVYAVVFAILAVNGHSKAEYLAAAYGPLFAAGGVVFERARAPWARLVLRWLAPVVLLAGLGVAPLVLPILPVRDYVAFAERVGVKPHTPEGKNLADLPQLFADMHGWEDLGKASFIAWRMLEPDERPRCVIYAQNYGEASAATFFNRGSGMPPAVSGHNSYYFWGPGSFDTTTAVVVIGGNEEQLRSMFMQVRLIMHFSAKHIMPYENNLPIYICRGMTKPPGEVWAMTKHFE